MNTDHESVADNQNNDYAVHEYVDDDITMMNMISGTAPPSDFR